LKVVHIHRRFKAGAYSIEELFHTVAAELRKDNEVIEYEAGPRKAILQDGWRLRRMNADIYHVTGDIHYMVFLLPWHKTVLTVHDVGHFLYGLHGFKRWLYKWLWLAWPMRAACAVTAVSRATEDNIVSHIRIPRSHVMTIENCHNRLFGHVPRPFNKEYPTILQVGTKPYKNVPRLIAALRGIPCKLVLIGALDQPILQKLAECEIHYENRFNLTREELVQAYIDCDIVSFVSIEEGFGVPIIEAQASGRPLITANIPPMSEVACEGACQVPPLDVGAIRAGILKIIRDDDYRTKIVEAGIHNAARFSPQAISRKYLALYHRVSLS
jgi:glycosyltransferase involved in cell wall biosynthesis